jgi:hypothetical protein
VPLGAALYLEPASEIFDVNDRQELICFLDGARVAIEKTEPTLMFDDVAQ